MTSSGEAGANIVSTAPEVQMSEAVPTKVTKGVSGISKVTIIAKPEKLDALKLAMDEIGIMGMTVTRVMVTMDLLPKIKAEIVVSEIPVQTVVNAARKALYTGHMGDGKIFVYDVDNVIRISSGSQGQEALDYE